MSKSHIIFLILIASFSCNSPKDSNKRDANEHPDSSTVTKALEPDFNTQTVRTYNNDDFAGTTYFLTSDYDLDNCENLSRCDCCASELAFVDRANYVYMFTCEASLTFNKGIYNIDGNNLTLINDSLLVTSIQPMHGDELDENYDSTQYGIFASKQFTEPLEFTISDCNGRTLISMINNKEKDRGTEENRTSFLRSVLSDQTSEIAQKLGMK